MKTCSVTIHVDASPFIAALQRARVLGHLGLRSQLGEAAWTLNANNTGLRS